MVKVKSVVVAPGQSTNSSKPMKHPLSEKNTKSTRANQGRDRQLLRVTVSQSDKRVSSARSQRLVTFNGDLDQEQKKQQFVQLVTRHMNENQANQELLKLTTSVADQRTGLDCSQWQHPSDLTRRNYRRRFGNSLAKMTLSEWQAQNHKSYQRFGKLSKGFVRCHLSCKENEKKAKEDVADPENHDHIQEHMRQHKTLFSVFNTIKVKK